MIAERMWLITQRLVCVRLTEPALSNVWWPVAMKRQGINAEKALALWLNSTLGLLTFFGHRVPTRGPWVQFKKPLLTAMPVLNVHALDRRQLSQLASTYDSIADLEFNTMQNMGEDEARISIDGALSHVLGLPDLGPLRSLLAHEPIVCGLSLRRGEPSAEVEEQLQFELL